MIDVVLRTDFSQASFAPFGAVIECPDEIGQRRFFTEYTGATRAECAPVFHTNRNRAASLPLVIEMMERHPYASQAFMPLDVSRYVVVVAPATADGLPDVTGLQAFVVPGHLGVIYGANIWHAPASVLDREASFVVLMWRGADGGDDVFTAIEPVRLDLGSLCASEVT